MRWGAVLRAPEDAVVSDSSAQDDDESEHQFQQDGMAPSDVSTAGDSSANETFHGTPQSSMRANALEQSWACAFCTCANWLSHRRCRGCRRSQRRSFTASAEALPKHPDEGGAHSDSIAVSDFDGSGRKKRDERERQLQAPTQQPVDDGQSRDAAAAATLVLAVVAEPSAKGALHLEREERERQLQGTTQHADKPDALQRDFAAERNAAILPNASQLQLHAAILAFLQDAGKSNVKGVAFAMLCSRVQATSTDRLREALDQLISEGLVYTTVDEDHFLRL